MKPGAKPKARAPGLTLREIQDQFQAAILSGDERVLATVLDNSRTSRTTLFGVYRNAYASRLTEILANDYEALALYCGDEEFSLLAHAYIEACPSRFQNARWFGAGLPNFLRSNPRYAPHAELAEIADIEKAASDAFDAPDQPVLGLAGLSAFAAEDWPRLTFAPHASVSRLVLTTNALEIWGALREGEQPPPLQSMRQVVLVWRQGSGPKVRSLGDEEAMMWNEAAKGVPFGTLCELLATYQDPDTAAPRAAGYLRGWIETDMLTGVGLYADAHA